MKILHLIRALGSGGGERMVVELSNRLAELGHDVTVCMMEDPARNPARAIMRDSLSEKVHFMSLQIPGRWNPVEMYRVSKRLRALRADVLHIHMCGVWYLLPLLLHPKPSDPVIVETIHTLPSEALHRSVDKRLFSKLYRIGRIHPVVLSQRCADEFENMYPGAKYTIIPNGRSPIIPTDALPSVAEEIATLRPAPEAPVFIHIARFNEAKNQKGLIEVFNYINSRLPFTLLVIGRGYDSPQAWELRRQACRNIHFLGEKSNSGDYMLLSDFLCLTSRYEGMPVTVIEALSCGVTPVCTPVGGIPDMLVDGVTGYLSRSTDTMDYAYTLMRAIQNPLRPSVLRNLYAAKFSIGICADRHIDLYNHLILSGPLCASSI